jgi:hypothetical protein
MITLESFQGCKDGFNIYNTILIIQQINTIKDKKHMIIAMEKKLWTKFNIHSCKKH